MATKAMVRESNSAANSFIAREFRRMPLLDDPGSQGGEYIHIQMQLCYTYIYIKMCNNFNIFIH